MHRIFINTELLIRLWIQRSSGILMLDTETEALGTLVAPLQAGGPIGDQGVELVRYALTAQGDLSFEEIEVGGQGDRQKMAELFFTEACRFVRTRAELLAPEDVLAWGTVGNFAFDLPISAPTRRALRLIGEGRTLRDLQEEIQAQPDPLRLELSALIRLGALRIQQHPSQQPPVEMRPSGLLKETLEAIFMEHASLAQDCAHCPGLGANQGCEHWARRAPPLAEASHHPLEQMQIELLEHALSLVAEERWVEADSVLSRARDLRVDNASVLAVLAFVRSKNTRRDPGKRVAEAQQLLRMAIQLDEAHPAVCRVQENLGDGLRNPSLGGPGGEPGDPYSAWMKVI